MGQAMEYGSSLARFIARQNAASALAEEWEVVDVAVQEMMKTGNFERIVVMDPAGVVRASSLPALVGKPYTPAGTEPIGKLTGGAAAVRYHAKDESILGFEAPATFQDKLVGRVALGIAEKPLTQVAQLSITLMSVLLLITVAAVALAMYFIADWFAKPIRLVGESLREIAKGNFTTASPRAARTSSACCSRISTPWRSRCRIVRAPRRRALLRQPRLKSLRDHEPAQA
jgi:serine/threonine-protein kinase